MTAMELESAEQEIAPVAASVRRNIGSSLLNSSATLADLYRECAGDSDLLEVLEFTVENCIRYTITVCRYKQAFAGGVIDAEKLAEVEAVRKPIHNATIDSINALSRAMKRAGRSNTWIGSLAGNRAAYGKLALLLAFERMETYRAERRVI